MIAALRALALADAWIDAARALVLVLALALVLVLGACAHVGPRAAAFAGGVERNCAAVLGGVATDVVGRAVASAEGAAGVPTWGAFANGELLTRGVDVAICVVEQALAALDLKLPPAAADASGNVAPAAVAELDQHGFAASSAPPPALSAAVAVDVTAHARLVDFLNAHGIAHAHAAGAR